MKHAQIYWKLLLIPAFLCLGWGTSYSQQVEPELSSYGFHADERFCKSDRYPKNKNFVKPCFRVGSFTDMEGLFPSKNVKKGKTQQPLNYADGKNVDPKIKLLISNLEKSHPLTSILLWRNGTIQKEKYYYDRKDTDLFLSFSMHKTLSAMMIGVALDRKFIASIDDPVTKYVSELSGTLWEEVTIKNTLRMSSGAHVDQRGLLVPIIYKNEGVISAIKRLSNKEFQPGTKFSYNDVNTLVLGLIINKVFKKNYAEAFSEEIWSKIGAENRASMITNQSGEVISNAMFNARVRDYLRLGLLFVNQGKNQLGEAIIPKKWVDAIFGEDPEVTSCPFGRGCFGSGWGYSYQAWLPPHPGTFAFIGKYHQLIFVSRNTNTVLVVTSVNDPGPLPSSPNLMALIDYLANN